MFLCITLLPCDPSHRLVWATVLLHLSSSIRAICLLIVFFVSYSSLWPLPLMSLNSVLQSPPSLLFSFLYPHPPLYLLKPLCQSFISVSPAVCWSAILSCEGEQEWIEGLTENSEKANPCLSSRWTHLVLLSFPLLSSPLLSSVLRLCCDQSHLLCLLLLTVPSVSHGLLFLWKLYFKTDSEGKRLHTNTTKVQTGFFVPISMKQQTFRSLISSKNHKTQREQASESHPSCSIPAFYWTVFCLSPFSDIQLYLTHQQHH